MAQYTTGLRKGEEIMTETSPTHWNDHGNDVFIDWKTWFDDTLGYQRAAWMVSERMPGNRTQKWATFLDLEKALALAERLVAGRNP